MCNKYIINKKIIIGVSSLNRAKLYEDALFNHLILKGYTDFEAKVYVQRMLAEKDHMLNTDFIDHVLKKGKLKR
jgi:hypothetical protein